MSRDILLTSLQITHKNVSGSYVTDGALDQPRATSEVTPHTAQEFTGCLSRLWLKSFTKQQVLI